MMPALASVGGAGVCWRLLSVSDAAGFLSTIAQSLPHAALAPLAVAGMSVTYI